MTASLVTFRENLRSFFLAHRSKIARVVGVGGLVLVLTNVLNNRSHPVIFRCDLNDRAAQTERVRFVVSDSLGEEIMSLERRYELGSAPMVVKVEGRLRPGRYSVEELVGRGDSAQTRMRSIEVEKNGDFHFGPPPGKP